LGPKKNIKKEIQKNERKEQLQMETTAGISHIDMRFSIKIWYVFIKRIYLPPTCSDFNNFMIQSLPKVQNNMQAEKILLDLLGLRSKFFDFNFDFT